MRELLELTHKLLMNAYMLVLARVWIRLPAPLHCSAWAAGLGDHIHSVVRRFAERKQNHSTFFFRNRPELELIGRLAERKPQGSELRIAVVGCSKGAEVYSIVWSIRSQRRDLRLTVNAVDIAQDVVEFAKEGSYSLDSPDQLEGTDGSHSATHEQTLWHTHRDQFRNSIFERVSEKEMQAMFEIDGRTAKIQPWLKQGVNWWCGDAGDPELKSLIGRHDIVVANRFLCHMHRFPAERILLNLESLVIPGGHIFVSGVDVDVRAKAAMDRKWVPVQELMKEIHDGDPSIREGWPLQYWSKEPFRPEREDAMFRYASAFQIS